MSVTYRAILHGDQLEWLEPRPGHVENRLVEIVVPSESEVPSLESSGKIAALFEELARLGTFEHIADPVACQRELREDVQLPGRS